jgi:glycosyltransferase involved in cell wall biosynthesis
MKILHVIPGIAPRYGGPSQAIIEMCRALQDHGVEVLIATTDADGGGRLSVETGTSTEYQGIPTIFFSRQMSEAFKYSHDLACWLDKNVDSFDVVHIHAVFSHSSIAAAHACVRKRIPYILRPLGSLDPWSLKQKRFAKSVLWHVAVKRMLERASAVHYTTAEEKRLAEEALGISSGVVVPLGVGQYSLPGKRDDFRTIFPDLARSPYVLLLSRIHQKKNIEALLQAFFSITELAHYKHWKLVIAGDGEPHYVEGLKQLARQRCGDKVVFTGWLDGTLKAAVLRGATLFVLPSYQENFGLSVVEAMASRVPVIVSRQVNLSEEIAAAGAGWVVDLERGSLQQTLMEALKEEGERDARGAAGEDLARSRYTWPAIAKALYKLYDQVQSEAERKPLRSSEKGNGLIANACKPAN